MFYTGVTTVKTTAVFPVRLGSSAGPRGASRLTTTFRRGPSPSLSLGSFSSFALGSQPSASSRPPLDPARPPDGGPSNVVPRDPHPFDPWPEPLIDHLYPAGVLLPAPARAEPLPAISSPSPARAAVSHLVDPPAPAGEPPLTPPPSTPAAPPSPPPSPSTVAPDPPPPASAAPPSPSPAPPIIATDPPGPPSPAEPRPPPPPPGPGAACVGHCAFHPSIFFATLAPARPSAAHLAVAAAFSSIAPLVSAGKPKQPWFHALHLAPGFGAVFSSHHNLELHARRVGGENRKFRTLAEATVFALTGYPPTLSKLSSFLPALFAVLLNNKKGCFQHRLGHPDRTPKPEPDFSTSRFLSSIDAYSSRLSKHFE
ncbi:hypothetical protein AB1Y20_009266 [Prymnesium parvum]|uniref:Uncharacterized protein n=1 Tax=Prymnesium parvum TaxID=97485 RepID=A0AB34K569_PRYPA